tara:strand:+ start:161 stop:550 length:390 start_codon:yes stop_codon:yes gene_type:complete
MSHQKCHNNEMKSLFIFALAFFFIFISLSSKVHASENKSNLNKSQKIISNKYAERFCNAKADYFFEGLDNERTLKYSYFKYIGLQNEEIFSKDMYKNLINQIREKCLITINDEREINEFFLKKSQLEKK